MLKIRGIIDQAQAMCPLCNKDEETTNNVLVTCYSSLGCCGWAYQIGEELNVLNKKIVKNIILSWKGLVKKIHLKKTMELNSDMCHLKYLVV